MRGNIGAAAHEQLCLLSAMELMSAFCTAANSTSHHSSLACVVTTVALSSTGDYRAAHMSAFLHTTASLFMEVSSASLFCWRHVRAAHHW